MIRSRNTTISRREGRPPHTHCLRVDRAIVNRTNGINRVNNRHIDGINFVDNHIDERDVHCRRRYRPLRFGSRRVDSAILSAAISSCARVFSRSFLIPSNHKGDRGANTMSASAAQVETRARARGFLHHTLYRTRATFSGGPVGATPVITSSGGQSFREGPLGLLRGSPARVITRCVDIALRACIACIYAGMHVHTNASRRAHRRGASRDGRAGGEKFAGAVQIYRSRFVDDSLSR